MPPRNPAAGPAGIPLAPVALGFAVGIAAGRSEAAGTVLAIGLPLLLVAVACAQELRTALLALLVGLLVGRLEAPDVARPPAFAAQRLPAVYAVEGVLLRADPTGARTQRLLLEVRSLGSPPRKLKRAQRLDLRLVLRGIPRWDPHALVPGARVRCLARVTLRRGRLRGLVHDRRALEVLASSDSLASTIARLRTRASWTLSRGLDRRDDGLARALLLGDRSRLDLRDQRLFRRTGQAHLLAVSGLHVGLLLGGLLLLLRILGAPPRWLWWIGLLIVALYVPFTGTQPSAVRAGLCAAAWFVARLLGRSPRGASVLTLVALAILASRSAAIGDVSFQLSFAAVSSILLLGPRLRALLVAQRPVIGGLLPRRRAPVRTALAVSIAAWIGSAPFVATYIGRLCPAGPLLSLIALPLTAALLGSGFLYLLFAAVSPIAAATRWVHETAADVLRAALEAARAAHLEAQPVAAPSPSWWLLYGAGLVLAARAAGRLALVGWSAAACLLALLFVSAGLPLVSAPHAPWNPDSHEYDATAVTSVFLATEVALPSWGAALAMASGLLFFAIVSVLLGWLGPRAAGAAWGLGLIAFLAFTGFGVAALFAPFLGATLLGKLPSTERSGPRNLRQVLCNGVPAFLGCLLALSGRPEIGFSFFLGALACLGGDSCATEIGTRYGGQPFRLAGRGPIRVGESGGVTVAGLIATIFGAALAPGAILLCYVALGGAFVVVPEVALIVAAGVGGSLLDSVLGGWLQFRGRAAGGVEVTELPWQDGAATERVSGWRWLDNDAVNLVSGMAAGVFAVALLSLA